MDDLISRHAVIDAIHNEWDECCAFYGNGRDIALYTEYAIDQVPSSHPMTGYLSDVVYENEWYGEDSICGLCGCHWQGTAENYCPSCGARMLNS